MVLGGGGIALLTSLLTLRSSRKKAAEEAEAEELSNADRIIKMQTEYVVQPLEKEIKKLRSSVNRMERALDKISDCPHSDKCPVKDALQDKEQNS